MGQWEDFCERANAHLQECKPILRVADALKVSPLVVAAAVGFFGMSFMLYGFCGQLICSIVGFAYPAFESFKVIESLDVQLMKFWLTYWVCFASIYLLESMGYYVIIWLPFYYPLKFAVLIWLVVPSSRGAEVCYSWLVKPFFKKNQEHIDDAIDATSKEMKRSLSGLATGASSMITTGATVAIMQGAGQLNQMRRSLSRSFSKEGDNLVKKPVIVENEPAAEPATKSDSTDAAGDEKQEEAEQHEPKQLEAAQDVDDEVTKPQFRGPISEETQADLAAATTPTNASATETTLTEPQDDNAVRQRVTEGCNSDID